MMTPEQIREKTILQLRRICDQHISGARDTQSGLHEFRNFILEKPLNELRTIAGELGLSTDFDDNCLTMAQIDRIIIRFLSYIEGRLEIYPDGSGFLREVHLASGKPGGQYDRYDVYVPPSLIQLFSLKGGEAVTGLRRWPYTEEQYMVMLQVDKVKQSSVPPPAIPKARKSRKAKKAVAAAGTLPTQERAAMEQPAITHGPCPRCEHYRQGGSITSLVFPAILDAMKPRIGRTHSEKLEAERGATGEFTPELETHKAQKTKEWNRRPTALMPYCGLAEFQGRYYVCDVKNDGERCDDFRSRPADATAHNCRTCAYNASPMTTVLTALEKSIRSDDPKGTDFRQQDVRPALDAQADFEYRECVDNGGFLRKRPGLLPTCEALSRSSDSEGDGLFVVGPVVNSAGRCAAWQQGANLTSAKIAGEAQALAAEAAFKVMMGLNPPPYLTKGKTWNFDPIRPLHLAAGNAQSSAIEYCLAAFGLDPDTVATLGNSYMHTVWYAERDRSPTRTSERQPLVVEDSLVHPKYLDVKIAITRSQPPAGSLRLPGTVDHSLYIAYRYIDKTWRYTTIASFGRDLRGYWQGIYTEKGQWVPIKIFLLGRMNDQAMEKVNSAEAGEPIGSVVWLF
jgi:hypothetical protein